MAARNFLDLAEHKVGTSVPISQILKAIILELGRFQIEVIEVPLYSVYCLKPHYVTGALAGVDLSTGDPPAQLTNTAIARLLFRRDSRHSLTRPTGHPIK
jgi:hypothetical protein